MRHIVCYFFQLLWDPILHVECLALTKGELPIKSSNYTRLNFVLKVSARSENAWVRKGGDARAASHATMTHKTREFRVGLQMARRLKDIKEIKIERPQRAKLSAKEVIKRMEEFPKRREQFIATVRKRKN